MRLIYVLLLGLLPLMAVAEPRPYAIDYGASEISFTYDFSGGPVRGKFPEFTGDLIVDFQDIRNSSVSVEIAAAKAKAGFAIATASLRGEQMLDVDRFPSIRFRSTGARVTGDTVQITGDLTIRDVTRPQTLVAQFQALAGRSPADLDRLAVVIKGQLNRHDFGVSGNKDIVGDLLNITINATIVRQ